MIYQTIRRGVLMTTITITFFMVVLGWLLLPQVSEAYREASLWDNQLSIVMEPSLVVSNQTSNILRVDANSEAGNPDGSSWENAYANLQEALTEATTIAPTNTVEIWVAKGVYTPTNSLEREATFQLLDGVELYGGFAGGEESRDTRDYETNITVLSGDIDGNDTTDANGVVTDTANISGSNAYHVVWSSGNDSSAILDGFTINAGHAHGRGTICPDNCGGGMYNRSSSAPMLMNVIFRANSADEKGGGMYNDNSDPTLTNVAFHANSASGGEELYHGGGGMYNYFGSDPTLINVTFTANSASIGGGIRNDGGDPTLTDVMFSANSASVGGGMFNHISNPMLTNVTFNTNSASSGSGGGMYNVTLSDPTLINVSFIANSASSHGGGMFNVDGSDATLTNATFSGNSAGGVGGGMYNFDYSRPTLTNVSFIANSAGSVGGGMYNFDHSGPTLTNVSFIANSASSHGGGMYNNNWSRGVLTNVTFSANSAGGVGGGIRNYDQSHQLIQNSILWGNKDSSGIGSAQAQIANNEFSNPTVRYSIVQSGLSTDTISGGHNLLNQNPLFVAPSNPDDAPTTDGDFRLQADSPAIDTANNAICPNQDIRGEARNDLGCDMGAYELTFADSMSVTKSISATVPMTYTFGPTLVKLQVTDGSCLTGLTVEQVDGNHPNSAGGQHTGKYWSMTGIPNGCTGFDVNLTLPLPTTFDGDEEVCRYTGTSNFWDCARDSSDNSSVTRNNVTQFSDWAVGDPDLGPLVVQLATFSAEADSDQVRIQWQTVSELNNLGFNLYRSTTPDGELTQLNSELIPAQAPGSGQGFAYEWQDEDVPGGATYYYWLEDVDVNGTATLHGPVSATVQEVSAVTQTQLTVAPVSNTWFSLFMLLTLGILSMFFVKQRIVKRYCSDSGGLGGYT